MPGTNSIDGLMSGLDTSEIIDVTIEVERQSAVLLENQQTLRTRELTVFSALEAKILALKTQLSNLNSRSDFTQSSISISDDTLLSATANDEVASGTYSINILSLAKNHQIASQGFNDATENIMGDGTITISLGNGNEVTIDIDQGESSLVDIKNAINDADAGVTATIINDGTSSNPYRLVLTGDETGQQNVIHFSSDLTGGEDLNFDTASFDDPEMLSQSSGTSSEISLSASSSYTGSSNTNYIFTVMGSGEQTVGTGNITIEWVDANDPTNTGQIVVDQADADIVGPDGLKLRFTDGELTAGDSFQVSTFSPLMQQAADAKITLGDTADGASPIIINSSTNTFEDIISGMDVDIYGITDDDSGPVTIQVGLNTEGIKENLQSFINSYNDVISYIDEQNTYNEDAGEIGVLLGDNTLLLIESKIRSMVINPITSDTTAIRSLADIGIRTDEDGQLSISNSSKLEEAIEEDFESLMNLFVDSGSSDNDSISFLVAGDVAASNQEYEIDITQAATHGYFKGEDLNDPTTHNIVIDDTNNKLRLRVDGLVSDDLVLAEGTYNSGDDIAAELQRVIDADDNIGDREVSVEWITNADGSGYLKITSGTWGSNSKVKIYTSGVDSPAFSELGLANGGTYGGLDVEGTINGEEATGSGQILRGNTDNETTDGFQVRITLDGSELVSGVDATVSLTRGMSSVLKEELLDIVDSQYGLLTYKTSALEDQIDDFEQQIEDIDERLELRRELLYEQWQALETALAELETTSTFLETQLAQIESNTSYIIGKN